jgi:hypothetical protein
VSCPWLRTPPPSFCAGVGEATTLDLTFRTRTGDTASISLTLPQLRTALGTSQRAVFAITRESCEAILEDVVRALCEVSTRSWISAAIACLREDTGCRLSIDSPLHPLPLSLCVQLQFRS